MNLLQDSTALIRRHAWQPNRRGRGWYAQVALRLLLMLAMVTPFGALGTFGPLVPTRAKAHEPEPEQDEDDQPPPDCDDGDDCSGPCCPPDSGHSAPDGVPCPAQTDSPVYLERGSVVEKVTDLSVPGPLFDWSFTRSYDSKRRLDTGEEGRSALGYRWWSSAMGPYLVAGSGTCTVVIDGSTKRKFEASGSVWMPPPDYNAELKASGFNEDAIYTLTEYDTGNVYVFYRFVDEITEGSRGKLKERTTRAYQEAGLTGITYTYYSGDVRHGFVQSVTTAEPQAWEIDYSYNVTPTEAGRLAYIEVRNASDVLVARADYVYYGTASSTTDIGSAGDLVAVMVARRNSDGTTDTTRVTQYRYYNDSDTDGNAHQLKMVLESDAIQRIMDDNSNITSWQNLISRADDYDTGSTLSMAVEDFASRYFKYYTSTYDTDGTEFDDFGGSEFTEFADGLGVVKSEKINGACASCNGQTAGGITREYVYMDLNGGESPDDFRKVIRIVVEDTKDANGTLKYRTIYGINERGVKLREVVIKDPTAETLETWCRSISLVAADNPRNARQTMPSAHLAVTSDALIAEFLNPTGDSGQNDIDTISAGEGVVYYYEYDATYNGGGGHPTGKRVREGTSGSDHGYVDATDWYNFGGVYGKKNYLRTKKYSYPAKTTTRADGIVTSYDYTFWSGTDNTVIKTKTTTLPKISTSENGAGDGGGDPETTRVEYYDKAGRLRWSKDGEGYVNYYSYHPETGGLAYMMVDVNDPTSPGSEITGGDNSGPGGTDVKWIDWEVDDADGNKPTRSGLPTGLELVTKREYDDQGRLVLTIEPDGAMHYTVYEANATLRFLFWDGDVPLLPIQVTERGELSGQVVATYSVDPARADDDSGTTPVGLLSNTDQSHYVSWTRYFHDPLHGQLAKVLSYHDIPDSGNGSHITNYYVSAVDHDAMGRRAVTVDTVASGVQQVTQTVYDFLGRPIETKRKAGDTSLDTDPNGKLGTSFALPTMQTVSTTVYDDTDLDGDGDVGDSRVTSSKSFFGTGATEFIETVFYRTFRGHLRAIERKNNTTAFTPYLVQDVDWMGRRTASAQYTTAPGTWPEDYDAYTTNTSGRNYWTKTSYDDLGRVYRTERYPGTEGTNHFETNTWYDRNGRPVASGQKYSAHQEYAYDGAGRRYQSRTVMDISQATPYDSGAFVYNEPAPNPSLAAMITAGDGDEGVIEISHTAFDTAGNVIEQHDFDMNHNDADGIDIDATDSYVRATSYMWYDDADRLTTSAYFGSGDEDDGDTTWQYADVPDRPSEPSASTADMLVTQFDYNAASGRQELVTDPAGQNSKTFYDDLGRTTYVAENYDNFAPPTTNIGDGSDPSKDRVTGFAYNGLSQRTSITAYNGSDTDDQVTNYWFEDDYNASLNTHTAYPDSSSEPGSGTDLITVSYNLDGSPDTRTDQRGTVITYTYNTRRQVEFEKVTNVGDDTENAVLAIKREYDSLGRVEYVTSYDSATTFESGNVVNQIKYTRGSHGMVTETEQEHDGAVDGSTLSVQYAYDVSDTSDVYDDGLRLTSQTYPLTSYPLDYSYGSSGTSTDVNDRLGRVTEISVSNGFTIDANYAYNGTARLVEVDSQSGDFRMRFFDIDSGGANNYNGFDRFGRTVNQLWKATTGGTRLDQVVYRYDYAGNRTVRDLPIAFWGTNTRDQVYTYDGLQRLTSYEQGAQSGGSISGTPTRKSDWTLDQLGNWAEFDDDNDDDSSWELEQTRAHNDVNEIDTDNTHGDADASITGTPNWADPVYDAAGNMTTMPRPSAPTSTSTLKYDAWNRLVTVTEGSAVQRNEYDGLGRRVVRHDYVADRAIHYYYNESWQVVEERVGVIDDNSDIDGDPLNQYFWHPYYIDALAFRIYDEDVNGAGQVVQHFTHDANFNVTALLDDGGAVLERYYYTPYGEVTFLEADFVVASPQESEYGNTHLYTGRERDPETGLQLNRHRFYAAHLGRWVNRDPIGYEGSAYNLYEYVRGMPVHSMDPLGLADPLVCFAIYEECVKAAELQRVICKSLGISRLCEWEYDQDMKVCVAAFVECLTGEEERQRQPDPLLRPNPCYAFGRVNCCNANPPPGWNQAPPKPSGPPWDPTNQICGWTAVVVGGVVVVRFVCRFAFPPSNLVPLPIPGG